MDCVVQVDEFRRRVGRPRAPVRKAPNRIQTNLDRRMAEVRVTTQTENVPVANIQDFEDHGEESLVRLERAI